MSHIFISYSRKDIEVATKIVEALSENELETWIDWKDIPKAEEWLQEIYRGIEAAEAFLFLVSPDSIASKICNEELEHAVENGKRILPIIICAPETESVPESISKLNWIFCRDDQDNFDKAITEIHKTIETDYEWLKFHTELQVKALKWQRSDQEKSLLLRGKELEEAEKTVNTKNGLEPQLVNVQRRYLWESRQTTNRQRRWITIGLTVATLVMAGLAYWGSTSAVSESRQAATAQAASTLAIANEATAQTVSTLAIQNAEIAEEEKNRAEEQTQIARANQAAAYSLNFDETKLDLSLLLAVEGIKRTQNSQTENALLSAIQTNSRLLQIIHGYSGAINKTNNVAISPDGRYIAFGSDGKIRLWDSVTGKQIGNPFIEHSLPILSIAFSPDGSRIVSGSYQEIRLWDANTGQQIDEPLTGHNASVNSVAFSPNGSRIVSGSNDNTIRLWDTDTMQQVGEPLLGHSSWVISVAFSSDGSRIVSGSFQEIRLWDAKTGSQIGEPLIGHSGWAASVAFSPDGSRIISGSNDWTIRLWDANIGQQIGEPIKGHSGPVNSVAFSLDGLHIISASHDGTIRFWDTNTGQQIGEPLRGHSEYVNSVAFSPEGSRIVSGGSDQTIRLWDTDSGQQIGEPLRGHSGAVYSVAFSPDGSRIVSRSNDTRLWDTVSGQQIGKPIIGYSGITSVAFNPNGKSIAIGDDDGFIRLWDADIESWKNKACQRAGRNLTLQEWRTYFGNEPYEVTCEQWLVDEDESAAMEN